MSPFEAVMILCFGCAWPLSIWKSFRSRSNRGKSLPFMIVIFAGYVSGCLHKIHYSFDPVIALYILNAVLVFTDICLYARNSRLAAATPPGPQA